MEYYDDWLFLSNDNLWTRRFVDWTYYSNICDGICIEDSYCYLHLIIQIKLVIPWLGLIMQFLSLQVPILFSNYNLGICPSDPFPSHCHWLHVLFTSLSMRAKFPTGDKTENDEGGRRAAPLHWRSAEWCWRGRIAVIFTITITKVSLLIWFHDPLFFLQPPQALPGSSCFFYHCSSVSLFWNFTSF